MRNILALIACLVFTFGVAVPPVAAGQCFHDHQAKEHSVMNSHDCGHAGMQKAESEKSDCCGDGCQCDSMCFSVFKTVSAMPQFLWEVPEISGALQGNALSLADYIPSVPFTPPRVTA